MVLLRHHRTVVLNLVAALLLAIIWQWQYLPQATAATSNDAVITAVSFSSDSTTLAATGVTLTVNFTLSESIPADYTINLDIMSSTGCENWEHCQVDLSNSAVTGIDASTYLDSSSISLTTTSVLAAGSYTVTVTNVTSPIEATALRAYVSTGYSDETTSEDYNPDVWYTTASNEAVNIGTLLVSGTVTAGGETVANQWVETHNADWSKSRGTSTDDKGYYAIFTDSDDPGYWANDEYTLVAYTGDGSGYVTTSTDFTYSGTPLVQDVTLSEAINFFAGNVMYSDENSTTVSVQAGTPVTNANVCFNNDANNYCDATDELGSYLVAVGSEGGPYSAYVSANIDWSDPAQVADVDWHSDSDDEQYTAVEGITTVDFEVNPTTALVSGSVTTPDNAEAIDGSINFTSEEVNFWGSVSDGSFILNLDPNTYTVTVSPDTNQNSSWGRYSYSGTVTIGEGDNILDIELEELTAQVQFVVTTESDEPLEDINVYAWTEDHSANGETDSTGTAIMYVRKDTRYEVGAEDETYLAVEPNQNVTVADGSTEIVYVTMVQPNAWVNATFVDDEGNVADSLHGWFGCHTENYDRQFDTELHNGTVELGIAVDGTAELECSAWLSDTGAVTPKTVTVVENETSTLQYTLLSLNATIKTFVKDFSTGKKISADSNAYINLWNQTNNLNHSTQLDDNPVSIPVVADTPYTGNFWSETGQYTSLYSMNGDVVEAHAGATETLIVNVLENNATVHFNVYDPNGDPVEYGSVWCGNWGEVDFALDTVDTNVVIENGSEIRLGEADVLLVAGHTYRCGAHSGKEFVEENDWLSPPEHEITVSTDPLDDVILRFTEADAHLTGSVELNTTVNGVHSTDEPDSIWCWAWSEGGSSWTEVDPSAKNFRLPVSTDHDQWVAGCDAVVGEDWYFTEEPYEFTPEKGNNTKNFIVQKMPGWKVHEAVSETFDAGESKVMTFGDGTRLTIPAGTLAASGNVTVRGTPETSFIRTDVNPVAIPIDWEALDESGNLIENFVGGNVTIEIPYSEDTLTELGIEEDALVGKYWDGTAWKLPDNVTIDKDNNIVTIKTDHFTQYGVTYNARVSSVRKPKTPQVTVTSSGKHNVKLALRTKKTSPKSTRFVVQVRKLDAKNKTQWKTKTFRNADKKAQLKRSVQKLQRNKQYEVRAKACNSAGCSEQSNWKNFATE